MPASPAIKAATRASASGKGVAKRPLSRAIVNPSEKARPAPPSDSASQTRVKPSSLSCDHSASGQCPSSTSLLKALVEMSSNNRVTVSARRLSVLGSAIRYFSVGTDSGFLARRLSAVDSESVINRSLIVPCRHHLSPIPLAIMPLRTSVVPPWIVTFGATLRV